MLELRAATPEDANAIASVHVAGWRSAYAGLLPKTFLDQLSQDSRRAMWTEALEKNTAAILLAEVEGQIVGFIAFGPNPEEPDIADVWALYVKQAYWAQGIGRALWLACREHLIADGENRVGLWVLAENRQAIRFYEIAGFAVNPDAARDIEIGGQRLQELRYAQTLQV